MRTIKRGSRGGDVETLQYALNLLPDGIFGEITEEAVLDYQRSHNLTADGIVGAKTWASLGIVDGQPNIVRPSRRAIDKIIVHCSATPEGRNYTVADIRGWHLDGGFSDIGYHYVIYRDGSVHTGRNVDMVGAHCYGHNAHSIGICYIGGLAADGKTPKDTRTMAQRSALLSLLRTLRKTYPTASIHGHRDYAKKACPSYNATLEYKSV